jgi:hypothetical protein
LLEAVEVLVQDLSSVAVVAVGQVVIVLQFQEKPLVVDHLRRVLLLLPYQQITQ